MTENVLELSKSCRFEYMQGCGVTLCYTEHSPDSWYSDMATEVDIDRAKAMEIIWWLSEKFDIPETHGGGYNDHGAGGLTA